MNMLLVDMYVLLVFDILLLSLLTFHAILFAFMTSLSILVMVLQISLTLDIIGSFPQLMILEPTMAIVINDINLRLI